MALASLPLGCRPSLRNACHFRDENPTVTARASSCVPAKVACAATESASNEVCRDEYKAASSIKPSERNAGRCEYQEEGRDDASTKSESFTTPRAECVTYWARVIPRLPGGAVLDDHPRTCVVVAASVSGVPSKVPVPCTPFKTVPPGAPGMGIDHPSYRSTGSAI